MRRMSQVGGGALVTLACLFLAVTVHAGFYFESEQVMQGVPGQPDQQAIIKTYLSDDASRTDRGDSVTIMNYKTMTSYELNPMDKTYTQHDMTQMQGIPKMEGPQKEQFEEMMERMAASMKIEPTDETRTIAGYTCRKYDVQVMMAKGTYWVSKDIKGYDNLRRVTLNMAKAFEKNPMMKQMNILGMMDRIDGFPVETVMNVMGGKVTTTLKTIEEKSLDRTLFEIPAGYRLVVNE